jgi:predicted tellurium resistance membrane protein TerC
MVANTSMDNLLNAEALVSLLTLTAMEVVLGIDNIVFISILAAKLPKGEQKKARQLGLSLALVMRLGLLFAISWVMGLTATLFKVAGNGFSGRDLILLGGGLFLVAKATHEIHDKLEVSHVDGKAGGNRTSFALTLAQILALDIVFSLDSVITAVGMAKHISIMVVAMVLAVGLMLVFATAVSDFVNKHPSMKLLALSFLILIGVMLIVEGMGQHVSKGYIYFAMAFSLGVEMLNMWFRKKHAPVALHHPFEKASPKR